MAAPNFNRSLDQKDEKDGGTAPDHLQEVDAGTDLVGILEPNLLSWIHTWKEH